MALIWWKGGIGGDVGDCDCDDGDGGDSVGVDGGDGDGGDGSDIDDGDGDDCIGDNGSVWRLAIICCNRRKV